MKERVFNLFLIGDESFINEVGIATHDAEGEDSLKVELLKSKVQEDYKISRRERLPKSISWGANTAASRMGRQLDLFEKLMKDLDAPIHPLVVVTPIVNGQQRIEELREITAPSGKDEVRFSNESTPTIDWLHKYSKDGALDLPQLLNDDYFVAIRLLFNNGNFVSAAKLLMSFVDTIAFIECGDISGNFTSWLNRYAKLEPLGVTSTELWEFRNSLLHMTNLSSRKVLTGRVAPLILFVGGPPGYQQKSINGEKYFNFKSLLDIIANAVGEWLRTYNTNPEKFESFVERYDLTISDSRTFMVTL